MKNCRNCKYLIQEEEYREIWDDGGEFFSVLNCEKYQELSITDLNNDCREWEKFEIEE